MSFEISNLGSLRAGNSLRTLGNAASGSMEKISSGSRVNRGADDPSGLAIGAGMDAQLRGLSTAIQNVNDGVSLVRAADSVLASVQDIFIRIRDICVRGANSATLSGTVGDPNSDPYSDVRALYKEALALQNDIYNMAENNTFNGNKIFLDFAVGKTMQVGPDSSSQGVTITIPDLQSYGIPFFIMPPGDVTQDNFTAAFQQTLDLATQNLADMSDARANLGIAENQLASIANNLSIQYINIAASKSNIMDTNLASEMVSLTKSQIIMSSANFAAAQSSVDPALVFQLLNSAGIKI